MRNKDGVKCDRNGYAPSIMQTEEECFFCQNTEISRHEIYPGNGRRKISKNNGFWINLCPKHHALVQDNESWNKPLKIACQAKYEKTHSHESFMRLIGKNYL